MKPTALDKTFNFDGNTYHFRREFKDDRWNFAVFCGEEQIFHPQISTTVSDTKETMANFDLEHGRGAYEVFVYEHLMNTVTHIIPMADKCWEASTQLEGG